MQEIGRVQHLQRIEQRRHDTIELGLRGQAAEAAQPVLEARAPLEAHHHVGGRVGLEHARHAHDRDVLEARQRARLLEEVGLAPVEGLLVTVRSRPHVHGAGALAEIVRVVFLDRDHGAEVDVLGLIGDAEPARAHHAQYAVAAVENHSRGQDLAAVQCASSGHAIEPSRLPKNLTRENAPPAAGALARSVTKGHKKRVGRLFHVEQHRCAFANY